MARGEGCTQSVRCTKISVKEKGKSATIVNNARETYRKTQVDGCLLEHETAADWVVSKKGVGDVIIELKGVDIVRANEQILRTAEHLKKEGIAEGLMAGLIVGRRYPKFDTKVQKAQREFSKATGGPIHIVCRNRDFLFSDLFRFQALT